MNVTNQVIIYYNKDIQIYKGICMASLANSPTKAFVNKVNCILVMSTVGKTLKLVSKTKIYAGSEIIWCYTNSYRYPPQYN